MIFKMKKVVLAITLGVLMVNCGGEKKAASTDNLPVQSTETLDQAFKDEHNAKNSLDYEGTYRGTLPTASGEGMEVTLILTADAFSKSVSYVGKKDAAVVEQGKYTWDESGTIITLDGVDAPNQYFVSENVLFQLDTEGKTIEGDLAANYQLKKDMG